MKTRVLASLFLLIFATPIFSQPAQVVNQGPPDRVIINFMVPITPDTATALINIVNAQVRNGTKKITIAVGSSGGDPSAAFSAYNILKSVQAEITTFNTGNVDSAAMLLYCAGKYRYSLPSPARFLIHSAQIVPMTTNYPIERTFLEAQLAQINSVNQFTAEVIKDNSKKSLADIQNALNTQTILSPEQAKDWGIVQEIKPAFVVEPGAVFASVNEPSPKEDKSKPSTDNPVTSITITKP